MEVYVAEINGRGIAACQAQNDAHAALLLRGQTFRDDLCALMTGGLPLWDGAMDIHVRRSLPAEETKWRESRARAIYQGNIEPEDDEWIVFLVMLNDAERRRKRRNKDPRKSARNAFGFVLLLFFLAFLGVFNFTAFF